MISGQWLERRISIDQELRLLAQPPSEVAWLAHLYVEVCECWVDLIRMSCIEHVQRARHIFKRRLDSGNKRTRLQSKSALNQKPVELLKSQVANPTLTRRQFGFTAGSKGSSGNISGEFDDPSGDTWGICKLSIRALIWTEEAFARSLFGNMDSAAR